MALVEDQRGLRARDACLARYAAESNRIEEGTEAAPDVAQDCAVETDKLVEISNRDGDAKVAANIREDSQFRARGYVLKARGQLVF